MPRKLILITLLITFGINGCSLFQSTHTEGLTSTLPLLAPLDPARHIVQTINAQWHGHQDDLLCVLELDKKHIALAGLTPQGMSLFNLSYDGKNLNMTQSPLLPKQLPPDQIIKDMQLAYWPAPLLQKQLPATWRFTANSRQRRLYFLDELITEVNFFQPDPTWPKKVELINHRYHYKLLINTVSYETLPE